MVAAGVGERAMRAGRGWAGASAAALGLGLAIFTFYFAAYPIRHEVLPVGFDAPWYIWRARFVASQGIGPVQTSARPGHAILSAMLGPLTGQSQFELGVILSIVLVVLMALAIGALCRSGLGLDRGGWALSIAVSGAALGATRLLGENVANLLNTTFEVAAVVVLARIVSGEGALLWGAVALMVADGLAHWDFTAIFGLVLIAAFVLAIVAARREPASGFAFHRTEPGVLASAGIGAGAILAGLIGPVLHAPLITVGIPFEPFQLLPRIKTDLARAWAPAAAAVLGLFRVGPVGEVDASGSRRRAFTVRMLWAWTAVMAGGTLFGLVTSRAPAHRFFYLLVAVPGSVAVAATLRWAAARVRNRTTTAPRALPALGAIAVVVLALPAGLRWYRYPGLIQSNLLQQAETAGRFLERLPKGEPVVFLVDQTEGLGSYFAVPLKERTIRMGLPPDREPDLYVVPGHLADLLSGRQTPDPVAPNVTRPYWNAVRPVLALNPPIIVLRAAGPGQYDDMLKVGGTPVGPGVAALRAPPAARPVAAVALPRAVPPVPLAFAWFVAILALLGAAGAGWTRVIFGPRLQPESFVCLAPVAGAAVMILAGLVAAEAGIRLGGPGGVATYAAVALAGFGAAIVARRAEPDGPTRPNGSTRPFAEARRPGPPAEPT